MSTFAIGDIHGRRLALEKLLGHINLRRDKLVFLGDYCDRGPDTQGVLDLLISLIEHAPHTICLRGNHDAMMVLARDDPSYRQPWLDKFEGNATLASYRSQNINDIPLAHWYFLEQTCRNWHETQNHIFVHGGVNASLPLAGHPVRTLHWQRLHEAKPHVSGKRVICGHTQQGSGLPYNMGHTVCVDTRGWLTAMDVNKNTFIQVSNSGEFRSFDRLPPETSPPPPPVKRPKQGTKASSAKIVVEASEDETESGI